MNRSIAIVVTAAAATTAGAQLAVNESFDCYQPGAAGSGLAGWELWAGFPGTAEALISDRQAFSGGRSLNMDRLLSHPVHPVDFHDIDVTVRVMTYVPSESIGLDAHVAAWSYYTRGWGDSPVLLRLDSVARQVEHVWEGSTAPLSLDRWVEVRLEVRLGEGSYDLYYDGQPLSLGSAWPGGAAGHFPDLEAVSFPLHALESGPGMYVDDLLVTPAGLPAPPTCGVICYADCGSSGEVDFFDVLCFQNLFAAADPRADCDQDGGLTFFDFLCFQTAFAAGCP